MSEPSYTKSDEIDEAGFELGGEQPDDTNESSSSRPVDQAVTQRKTHSRNVEQYTGSKRLPLLIAAISAVVLVVGLGTWYVSRDDDDAAILAQSIKANGKDKARITGSEPLNAGQEDLQSISVVQGREGVIVNGRHDLLASLLLQNYPTRSELQQELSRLKGAEISQKELDAYLVGMKSNADAIARLKAQVDAGDNSEFSRNLAGIRKTVDQILQESSQQRSMIAKMQDELEKLKKNSGWYHNRLKKLEEAPAPVGQQKQPAQVASKSTDARRVELKNKSLWVVNGASETIAFLTHTESGQRLRVTRGFDIPGCGQVMDIDPGAQKVNTASCVITN